MGIYVACNNPDPLVVFSSPSGFCVGFCVVPVSFFGIVVFPGFFGSSVTDESTKKTVDPTMKTVFLFVFLTWFLFGYIWFLCGYIWFLCGVLWILWVCGVLWILWVCGVSIWFFLSCLSQSVLGVDATEAEQVGSQTTAS